MKFWEVRHLHILQMTFDERSALGACGARVRGFDGRHRESPDDTGLQSSMHEHRVPDDQGQLCHREIITDDSSAGWIEVDSGVWAGTAFRIHILLPGWLD